MWPQLPTELWLEIFASCSQRDLAVWGQTCKHLQLLTEPLLYSKVHWIPPLRPRWQESPSHQQGIEESPSQVHLLLRTILNRPGLAFHIKSAEFISPLSTNGELKNILPLWSSDAKSGFSQKDFDLARDLIREIRSSSVNEWLDGLQSGRSDIIVALLLSQLSELGVLDIRLRTLQYQPPMVGERILEILSSTFAQTGSRKFGKLKIVSLSIDRDHLGRELSANQMVHLYRFDRQVAPLFTLRSMEELHLAWIHPESPMGPSPIPISPRLKSLVIKDSIVDENVLRTLLGGTPQLEHLECQMTYDHFRNQQCNCEVLRSALDQVARTLQSLIISVHVMCNGRLADDWTICTNTIGSLNNFRELTTLAIPLRFLADTSNVQLVDVLPDRLRRFGVGWTDSRKTIQDIEGQLTEYIGISPMLKSMEVDRSKYWSQSFLQLLFSMPGNKSGDCGTFQQLELVLV